MSSDVSPTERSWLDANHAQGLQVGDGGTQHNHFYLERSPVRWPLLVGVIPPEADCFQDRRITAELSDLTSDGVTPADWPDSVTTWVLRGLGGAGKTQLAAQCARSLWDAKQPDLLVWVTAGSRTSIVTGYAEAMIQIEPTASSRSPELLADRFVAWLASTDRRWLVVLDDLTDPRDLGDLRPPSTSKGHTLVTTRRRDSALRVASWRLIDVDVFTPAEAVAYLAAKFDGDQARLAEAAQLARDLGYLPVALAQAAAYILDRELTCARYRTRLADQRRRLPELVPEPGALPDAHRVPVDATWSLSIELADRFHPVGLARPVLELAALLDPNAIPSGLFTTDAVEKYLADRLGKPLMMDDADDALRCLQRLSLVTHDHASGMVRAHALLQRSVREASFDGYGQGLARAAADGLVELWLDSKRDPVTDQMLRSNATSLYAHAAGMLWDETGAHPLLFRVGNSLGENGLLRAAADYFRELQIAGEHRQGQDHPDMLELRAHAARWVGEAGDPVRAAEAHRELIDDCVRVRGPGHSETLAARHNFVYWLGAAGDLRSAVTAMRPVLVDCQRELGHDHPHTLAIKGNLSRWQADLGDAAAAIGSFERLLADQVRVLGPDHPATLATRGNLYLWQGRTGDPKPAIEDIRGLLVDLQRVLGSDHPDTLTTRQNFAHLISLSGDPAGAAEVMERLSVDYARVFGHRHPRTLAARHSAAGWRGEAGNPKAAAEAMEALLPDCEQVFGSEDVRTLATRHDLARWRGEADRRLRLAAHLIALQMSVHSYTLKPTYPPGYPLNG